MITDRVLIFAPYPYNINGGGPSGFIAHNLLDKPRNLFSLPIDIVKEDRFRVALNKIIYKVRFHKYDDVDFLFRECGADNFKYIYFHDCLSLYQCSHLIKNNQVVVLQSHCPELPSEEFKVLYNEPIITAKYVNAERYAFERADILVFPNEYAVDIYSDLIKDYTKIKYILSGAKDMVDPRIYPLDQSKINILFVGRRNSIKGFDYLINTFKSVLLKRDDINLILVGSGKLYSGRNIFDVGQSNSPQNWFNSVDYVVNTNLQSYFDLSVIEALATGVPLILSNNYGHYYYEGKSKDISTFEVQKLNGLESILLGNLMKRDYRDSTNRNLYLDNLTDIAYFERFEQFCKSII